MESYLSDDAVRIHKNCNINKRPTEFKHQESKFFSQKVSRY